MHDVALERRDPAQLLEEITRLRADVARLESRVEELDRLAHQDPLVPLANRRGMLRELEMMIARHDRWCGIGEVLLRHDDLTELTYGENARAGHSALDPVLDICEARGWPLSFHQDVSSAGRVDEGEYAGEVVAMLERHPRVTQVWAHAGISRRVRPEGHVRVMADLLDAHDNLHVDLSWVAFDQVVGDQAWLRLVERHPDRFVLGSDSFGDVEQQPGLSPGGRS